MNLVKRRPLRMLFTRPFPASKVRIGCLLYHAAQQQELFAKLARDRTAFGAEHVYGAFAC